MTLSSPLILHSLTGLLAFAAAATALVPRKGGPLHRQAGRIFVVMMVLMTGSGILVAASMGVILSVIGGSLTLYLVLSGWWTVAGGIRRPGLPEGAGLLAALVLAGLALGSGLEAAASESGLKDGFHPGQYYLFGVLALLAAAGDARLFLVGGLTGSQRIARHLWRMCMALTIAAAAFFLGQAHLFPEAVRELPILPVPVLLSLLVMLFWLVRVRLIPAIRARRSALVVRPPAYDEKAAR